MAILYNTDGSKEEVLPKNGKSFSLKEAQELVGGYVEMLPVPFTGTGPPVRKYLLINEDGKATGLPANWEATDLMKEFLHPNDIVVGPALLIDKEEFQ